MTPFVNAVYLDWSNPENLKKQKDAIEYVKSNLGKEYPNYIGNQEIFTDKKTISYNPAHPSEVIGTFQKAGQAEAELAIQSAAKAFETWKYTSAEERANFLFKAAEEIKKRRLEINAWMIMEAGKSYAEADADTCEGIDFLEFYGREALRYAELQPLTPWEGEKNEYFYVPLGVGVCVPPWNFPFAIMAGITTAAIAAGNTVVLKPSSETPMMAWLLADIFRKIGLPEGVLNFFVASGAEAGDYLIDHPKTRFISFTGSMEVGLRIIERAAKTNPGQIWIKRVVAEMGGKDAILVDSETNVDTAVAGVVASAFGFQGQKCSACSRAIIHQDIYDEFVAKLKLAVDKLQIGDPVENYYSGPVISKKAMESILGYIEIGKKEGKLLNGGGRDEEREGYFIKPTVFVDVDPNARISQEEIFGPVLAVSKCKDFEDGLNIVNGTIYGLTGAVYTDNEEKIALAKKVYHCGNLYINRKCTGAMVDVHPFGGFNMSGTDSKAGSRDYLNLFLQGKSVATKI